MSQKNSFNANASGNAPVPPPRPWRGIWNLDRQPPAGLDLRGQLIWAQQESEAVVRQVQAYVEAESRQSELKSIQAAPATQFIVMECSQSLAQQLQAVFGGSLWEDPPIGPVNDGRSRLSL